MTPEFDAEIERLHLEITGNLGSLHLLHHKQQILNIQIILSQILHRLSDKDCDTIKEEITLLQDVISDNLERDNYSEIIHKFTTFLQLTVDDENCATILEELQQHISRYLTVISKESSSFRDHIQYTDLSKINTTEAYNQIIDPLSNQKRLDILMAVHNNKKRFKELERELELQAGHLIYHLNPLKEGGYVTQDSKKNYFLTQKGIAILKAIKHIYEAYTD